MENIWDEKTVTQISNLFKIKFHEFLISQKTDRKNRSALWNKYLEHYECKIVRSPRNDDRNREVLLLRTFLQMINHDNQVLVDSIVINNPDRPGQYLVIKRDVAERILVLGMI